MGRVKSGSAGVYVRSLAWPDPVLHRGKRSRTAVEQFVTPHRGVHTDHSSVVSRKLAIDPLHMTSSF